MKRLFRNQRGDTIVEVLLAITVLSVVLGISYSLATRAFRTLQISKDQIQAALILQEQAEGFRALRDELSFAEFLNTAEGVNKRVIVDSSNAWQVEDASGPYPASPLYQINSDVFFTDGDGDGSADTATITTQAQWERIGGGNDSQQLVTKLRDLKVSALVPSPPPPPPEICGNGTDDDGDGQINEGCPTNFTYFGGPGAMDVGQTITADLGTQRLVTQVSVSVGCNDGETGRYRVTFDDGSTATFNAGCNTTQPLTPTVTRGLRLTMLSGGGGDQHISFSCCGSSGWGAFWQ